jgi:UDP-N-acetylglucosamine 2-epimerase (non-hydrolysing)
LREVTERKEGVISGTAKLVGVNKTKIISETSALLNQVSLYKEMAKVNNPYGDGKSSERIIEVLKKEDV